MLSSLICAVACRFRGFVVSWRAEASQTRLTARTIHANVSYTIVIIYYKTPRADLSDARQGGWPQRVCSAICGSRLASAARLSFIVLCPAATLGQGSSSEHCLAGLRILPHWRCPAHPGFSSQPTGLPFCLWLCGYLMYAVLRLHNRTITNDAAGSGTLRLGCRALIALSLQSMLRACYSVCLPGRPCLDASRTECVSGRAARRSAKNDAFLCVRVVWRGCRLLPAFLAKPGLSQFHKVAQPASSLACWHAGMLAGKLP